MLFGRSMAHPSDTFVRNVSLLSLLLLGGILLYNKVTVSKLRTQLPDKPKVTCWTPAYFTSSHEDYSNLHCRETDSKFSIDGNQTHPRIRKVILPQGTSAWREMSSRTVDDKVTLLEKYVTAQAVVVMVAFLLLRNVACRAGTQARILAAGLGGSRLQQEEARRLRSSHCTIAAYVMIQACYFVAMMVFLGRLLDFPTFMWTVLDRKVSNSTIFLCNFQVRQMGNRHPHTIQCIGTTPAVGPELQTGLPQVVLYLDTVLCGAVALMVLLHLLQTLLISPASSDIMAAYDVSKSSRLAFGFTDMNLAAIFMNLINQHQMFLAPSGNSAIDEVETHEPFGKMEVI